MRPLAGLLDTALVIQKGQSCPEMLRYNGTACTKLQLLLGHDQLGKQSPAVRIAPAQTRAHKPYTRTFTLLRACE